MFLPKKILYIKTCDADVSYFPQVGVGLCRRTYVGRHKLTLLPCDLIQDICSNICILCAFLKVSYSCYSQCWIHISFAAGALCTHMLNHTLCKEHYFLHAAALRNDSRQLCKDCYYDYNDEEVFGSSLLIDLHI
jgi:hypothetical protein